MSKYQFQCSNCGQLLTKSQLIKLICIKNPVNGNVTKRLYDGKPYDIRYAYIVNGCPDCVTDTINKF